ncbi:MAG: pyridoxal 5'-phosphate synthase glutaminase subunit PdxT [Candidatus Helarchaeota archaeon]
MITIGVLGYQGDLRFHVEKIKNVFKKNNIEGIVKIVKKPAEIREINGLIISGGESTVMGAIAKKMNALEVIREKIGQKIPVLSTCAGTIFLAKKVYDKTVGVTNQPILEILDIEIERNSYGPQKDSFEALLTIQGIGDKKFQGIFIRAPVIRNPGQNVKVLAKFNDDIVAVQQENIVALTFHPEITDDIRIHEYFVKLIKN